MNTDLFHLYPTDGYTNGQRGNHSYGETNNANWTSQNGSKRGSSSVSGYSGTVFEPIDEYKGDLARTYFYMMTRYYGQVSGWSSDMLSGDNLSSWAEDMLMDWHREDTVSQKELDRNDEVYGIQNNRNPFIDHPSYAELIWGDSIISAGLERMVQEISIMYLSDALRVMSDEFGASYQAVIFDAYGRQVEEFSVEANSSHPLVLGPGVYFIHLRSGRDVYSSRVFVH